MDNNLHYKNREIVKWNSFYSSDHTKKLVKEVIQKSCH